MITKDDVIIERIKTYYTRNKDYLVKLKNGEIIGYASGVKETNNWHFLFNPSRNSVFNLNSKFRFYIKERLSIGRVRNNILMIMNYTAFKRELIKKVFEEI